MYMATQKGPSEEATFKLRFEQQALRKMQKELGLPKTHSGVESCDRVLNDPWGQVKPNRRPLRAFQVGRREGAALRWVGQM